MASSRVEGHGGGGAGERHADGKAHLSLDVVRKVQGAAAAREVDARKAGVKEPAVASASASAPASAPALPTGAGSGGSAETNGSLEVDTKAGSTRDAAPATVATGDDETKAA